MFSGDTLDVGVCAEYDDGERIWCHFRSGGHPKNGKALHRVSRLN